MQTYEDVRKNLPTHLQQYIVDQDYSRYTPIDQAAWRFSLRQLKSYLSKNAHAVYVDGLKKTGIRVDSIPRIDEMCEKLQTFGWYALPVSGFIPPAAFMELQSLNILPIASDMRSVDHILYTPAPDIVHEAAGHAPILVDEKFANYLKSYAQVAKKAIISSEDLAQYEAIRDLSDIKEDPHSTPQQIRAAEEHLNQVNQSISHISEAALLGRMNWWTAEYGLIGDPQQPKIFGAGLLSSVGESRSCLSPNVKKIPLTVDCVETSYDITEPQPQLFVAHDFDDLTRVLKDLEARLAFRIGGVIALERMQKAKTVNTVELDSGLQISGKLKDFMVDTNNAPFFIRFEGPCQLACKDKEIPGQGIHHHPHGFSSPIGLLQNSSRPLSHWTDEDLKAAKILENTSVTLRFTSGIVVEGILQKKIREQNSLLLLSFTDCTVAYKEQTLFDPSWGTFDMAVGNAIPSVYAGPADRDRYGTSETFAKKTIPRKNYSHQEKLNFALYASIREMREHPALATESAMASVFNELKDHFPNEWLAFVELLEISFLHPTLKTFTATCKQELERIQREHPTKTEYISLGMAIADEVI